VVLDDNICLTYILPHPRRPLDQIVPINGVQHICPPYHLNIVAKWGKQLFKVVFAYPLEDVMDQVQLPLEEEEHVLAAGGHVGHAGLGSGQQRGRAEVVQLLERLTTQVLI
jgi:hypothetical protein